MAKVKLEVNREEFQKVVADLESKQTFENPSALWKAVEQTDWAKTQKPRPITAAVAYARAKELNIHYQTKPGKRGRTALTDEQKAKMQEARKGMARRSGKEKMAVYAESFEKMRREIPERYQNLVDRAEEGSKTAMLKLKCLDCSCWQPKEITLCTSLSCPLFPIRPYQNSKAGIPVVEAEEDKDGNDSTTVEAFEDTEDGFMESTEVDNE